MPFARLYRQILHAGIDTETPIVMMERIVFSNTICAIATLINVAFMAVNLGAGYYFLLAVNGLYQLAIVACLALNVRHHHLAARLTLISGLFAGLLLAGAGQGPACEMEHFLLPLAVMSFLMFYGHERVYSYLFSTLAVISFLVLIMQKQPLLAIDPHAGRYTDRDLFANRLGYLAIFLSVIFAMTGAFNRALRLADEQRRQLFEERRLASIGAISCTVAHEINSPLAALDLQLFQLDRTLANRQLTHELLTEGLARIRRISQRISVIVRGLKFLAGQDDNDPLSRMEAGTILDLALDLSRDRLESHGIDLRLALEARSLEVACRPVAMSQVFLNLLTNAMEAVTELPPDKRWIAIEIRGEGRYVLIAIEDGGSITSPDVRLNLFKSFFTTKPPGRGTGLGLSISRETVEDHGGSLRFDGAHPNTRFVVKLPVIQDGVA